MFKLQATTATTGPLFDGGADRTIAAFIDAAIEDVTQEGLDMMHASASVFRHPTGNWERHLQADRAGPDTAVIEDTVVYNAWLEGVGSRNSKTRFRGYKMWRLATIRLQAKAPQIAERTLQRFLGRMG